MGGDLRKCSFIKLEAHQNKVSVIFPAVAWISVLSFVEYRKILVFYKYINWNDLPQEVILWWFIAEGPSDAEKHSAAWKLELKGA